MTTVQADLPARLRTWGQHNGTGHSVHLEQELTKKATHHLHDSSRLHNNMNSMILLHFVLFINKHKNREQLGTHRSGTVMMAPGIDGEVFPFGASCAV